MNKIDIIVILNLLTFLALIFFVFIWFRNIRKKHGIWLALLVPVAVIAFIGTIGEDNGGLNKELRNNYINNITGKKYQEKKVLEFEEKLSFFHYVDFEFVLGRDSCCNYDIVSVLKKRTSSVNANLEFQDFNYYLTNENDSIYDLNIVTPYKTSILFLFHYHDRW